MSKLPGFYFYIGDWMKDPALRAVSDRARGLWIDILCLMYESPRRGYLETATGEPVTAKALSRMTGVPVRNINRSLVELSSFSVCSLAVNGTIYSRRIVRDEERREGERKRQAEHRNAQKANENGSDGHADVTDPVTAPVTAPVTTNNGPVSQGSSTSASTSTQVQDNNNNKRLSSTSSPKVPPAASPPESGDFVLTAEAERQHRAEEKHIVGVVESMFRLYCDLLHRDPKRYVLTPTRKEKGLIRLRHRIEITGSLAGAVADFTQAIKNLAASEYHTTNGYIDWIDHICNTDEVFDKRLNWIAPKTNGGQSHVRTTFESLDERIDRIGNEAIERVRMEHQSSEATGEAATIRAARRA